ncbi:MAG: endolytic transglycosylase MltG, partial [Proteobacteria bacterium]|nr:endolytic transglycosylase MltG [Pseudomonadota bacterium]
PEGFTLRLLNERIATKGVAQMPELTKLIHDNQFLRELGVNSTSLEGYTYPATYNFEKMPTAREFYAKVVGKFFENLSPDYVAQITKRGLTLNQAVTFASLIELETMQETEKPLIAEVIWRRLKKGDALGIDAAVIYGISDYQGDITWQHLKDAKNPYNTRIHRGLPPTAIGAVTKTSLDAVLNPTNLGYYYYMLDSDDRTRHVFSRTGSEHNVQVQRFLKAQKTELKRRPQQP